MYTGITSGLFKVTHVEKKPGLIIYKVKLNSKLLTNLAIGASVAIDGTCQTVVAIDATEVTFNAMQTTLELTTLSDLYSGRMVSVERSLRYGDEVGGHEIAGHIIGTAIVSEIKSSENNLAMTISCPKEWIKYIFPKGFIAVDGSSLTVVNVDIDKSCFTLYLIPETLRVTNFANKKINDRVNIELDHKTQMIVATVENFLQNLKFSNILNL